MSKFDAFRVNDYLRHILEAIDRIHRYVDDTTELTFLMMKRRKMRSCEILKSWERRHTT